MAVRLLLVLLLCVYVGAHSSDAHSDTHSSSHESSPHESSHESSHSSSHESDYPWADDEVEFYWIIHSLLACITFLGFLFEHLDTHVEHCIKGEGHEMLEIHENVWLLLYKSFHGEITVLGCITFTSFMCHMLGVYDDIAAHTDEGRYGPTHSDFSSTVEVVHIAIFMAMALHLTMTGIYAKTVQGEYRALGEFKTASEADIASKPYMVEYQKMCTYLQQFMQEQHGYEADRHEPAEYLRLKLLLDLRRVMEFNATSWVITACVSALLAVFDYYGGATNPAGFMAFTYFLTMVINLCIIGYFSWKRNDFDPANLSAHKVSNNKTENFTVRLVQALQFYNCYHVAFVVIMWGQFHHSSWWVEVIAFIPYFLLFPYMLAHRFAYVMSLPPYFDQKDLGVYKHACGDPAAFEHLHHATLVDKLKTKNLLGKEKASDAVDEEEDIMIGPSDAPSDGHSLEMQSMDD